MRSRWLALLLVTGCGAAGAADLCHPSATLSMPAYTCGGGAASAAPAVDDTAKTDDTVTSTTANESTTDQGTASSDDQPARAVALDGDTITVKDPITFESGTATLTDDAQIALLEVAKFLDGHSELSKVQVSARADAPKKKAQKLSDAQAKAVKDFLVSKGIDKSRLVTKGFGKGDAAVVLTVLARDQ
jgi:outer membrane protein OmpA-like peptidoglycan-associated protein